VVKTIGWGNEAIKARIFELSNGSGVTARISDLGGIITSIITPDKNGEPGEITLGYDSFEEYLADDAYFGATVGRYANRIAGAKFSLNGEEYHITRNDGDNALHGGAGLHKKLWSIEEIFDDGILMNLRSADGEDGFPGNVSITLEARLTGDDRLKLWFTAVSDKDTVISLTNHAYFNLRGFGDILSHSARINAQSYTPVNGALIPTGDILPVAGTEFDFRAARLIKEGFYDHNFALDGDEAAFITEPETGRALTVYTSLPGVQFYCGGMLTRRRGRGGTVYDKNSGFCLEPQFFPDSPNIPAFPSCVLKAGGIYKQYIAYKFGQIQ
jgi:aldose 1-epimerase